MTELSEPRAEATKYTIYPKGYDQSPLADTHNFCIFVEQYPDTGRWRIHDGSGRWGQIVTVNGTWTTDRPQVRHLTRFDTAEDAIKVALVAVEDRGARFTLQGFLETPRGQAIQAMHDKTGEPVE